MGRMYRTGNMVLREEDLPAETDSDSTKTVNGFGSAQ
jgi:hypothetical protein